MNVVITGATSMIGCAILEEFVKDDSVENIFAVIRGDTNRLARLPNSSKIKIIKCDIDKYELLPSLINTKCDVFYHVAWSATGKARNENLFKQIDNIQYTLKALYAAKELSCSRFIGAGSQAEYGVLGKEPVGPDAKINPVQPYGIAKFASGKFVMEEATNLDICCIWVRIFSVYGVFDKMTTFISTIIAKMMNNEYIPMTKGEQIWDYLYSSDAGKAFHLLGTTKNLKSKVYCLGSGAGRKIIDYVSTIKKVLNSQSELGIGDIEYSSNIMNLCADISDLTNDTGWKPVISFEEGIKNIYETLKHSQ